MEINNEEIIEKLREIPIENENTINNIPSAATIDNKVQDNINNNNEKINHENTLIICEADNNIDNKIINDLTMNIDNTNIDQKSNNCTIDSKNSEKIIDISLSSTNKVDGDNKTFVINLNPEQNAAKSVANILDMKYYRAVKQFLVHWQGQEESQATWEFLDESIDNFVEKVNLFDEKRKQQKQVKDPVKSKVESLAGSNSKRVKPSWYYVSSSDEEDVKDKFWKDLDEGKLDIFGSGNLDMYSTVKESGRVHKQSISSHPNTSLISNNSFQNLRHTAEVSAIIPEDYLAETKRLTRSKINKPVVEKKQNNEIISSNYENQMNGETSIKIKPKKNKVKSNLFNKRNKLNIMPKVKFTKSKSAGSIVKKEKFKKEKTESKDDKESDSESSISTSSSKDIMQSDSESLSSIDDLEKLNEIIRKGKEALKKKSVILKEKFVKKNQKLPGDHLETELEEGEVCDNDTITTVEEGEILEDDLRLNLIESELELTPDSFISNDNSMKDSSLDSKYLTNKKLIKKKDKSNEAQKIKKPLTELTPEMIIHIDECIEFVLKESQEYYKKYYEGDMQANTFKDKEITNVKLVRNLIGSLNHENKLPDNEIKLSVSVDQNKTLNNESIKSESNNSSTANLEKNYVEKSGNNIKDSSTITTTLGKRKSETLNDNKKSKKAKLSEGMLENAEMLTEFNNDILGDKASTIESSNLKIKIKTEEGINEVDLKKQNDKTPDSEVISIQLEMNLPVIKNDSEATINLESPVNTNQISENNSEKQSTLQTANNTIQLKQQHKHEREFRPIVIKEDKHGTGRGAIIIKEQRWDSDGLYPLDEQSKLELARKVSRSIKEGGGNKLTSQGKVTEGDSVHLEVKKSERKDIMCSSGGPVFNLKTIDWDYLEQQENKLSSVKISIFSNDALVSAVRNNEYMKVKTLLEQPNKKYNMEIIDDRSGQNLIWTATRFGFNNIICLLAFHGANIEKKNVKDLSTPIIYAAQKGSYTTVDTLCNLGCNVNHVMNGGETAMTKAIKNGHKGVAYVLLEHGTNVGYQLPNEKSYSTMAKQAGHLEIYEALTTQRAKLNSELLKSISHIFESSVKIDQPVFAIQLFRCMDSTQFQFTFHHELQSTKASKGKLLFIGQGQNVSMKGICDLKGKSLVTKVLLNDTTLQSISDESNFIFTFSPLHDGVNTVTISTLPVSNTNYQTQLIVCAYDVILT